MSAGRRRKLNAVELSMLLGHADAEYFGRGRRGASVFARVSDAGLVTGSAARLLFEAEMDARGPWCDDVYELLAQAERLGVA